MTFEVFFEDLGYFLDGSGFISLPEHMRGFGIRAAVTEHIIAPLLYLLDDGRIIFADGAVKKDGAWQFKFVEQRKKAPDAHPVAVIAPCVIALCLSGIVRRSIPMPVRKAKCSILRAM